AGEDNHSVAAPRSPAIISGVTDPLWRPAGSLDLLEYSVREESDEAAVGRPERIRCVIGSVQWLSGERIERAHPELALAGGIGCGEGEQAAVGRDSDRIEGCLLRRQNGELQQTPLRRSFAKVDQRNGEGNHCKDGGRH